MIKKFWLRKSILSRDLAMAGPQPRMVIDYIKEQSDWIVIQGNTDKMIAEFSPEIMKNVKKMPLLWQRHLLMMYFILR